MQRVEFMRLCVLAASGAATGLVNAESQPADLQGALAASGIGVHSVRESRDQVQVSARIAHLDTFVRKVGSLGEGKVKASRNQLSFRYDGRAVSIDLAV